MSQSQDLPLDLVQRWTEVRNRSSGSTVWFAQNDSHVIATVTLQDDAHTIVCVGRNGIGVRSQVHGVTVMEAVTEAEATLRDLGWKTKVDGFK